MARFILQSHNCIFRSVFNPQSCNMGLRGPPAILKCCHSNSISASHKSLQVSYLWYVLRFQCEFWIIKPRSFWIMIQNVPKSNFCVTSTMHFRPRPAKNSAVALAVLSAVCKQSTRRSQVARLLANFWRSVCPSYSRRYELASAVKRASSDDSKKDL